MLFGSFMCQCCIPCDTRLARVLVMHFYCHLCVFLAWGYLLTLLLTPSVKGSHAAQYSLFILSERYLLVMLTTWCSFLRSGLTMPF